MLRITYLMCLFALVGFQFGFKRKYHLVEVHLILPADSRSGRGGQKETPGRTNKNGGDAGLTPCIPHGFAASLQRKAEPPFFILRQDGLTDRSTGRCCPC